MKITGIKIKNLASLSGETEIDFSREPLCSAGIFAITGVTGAGKSTILDALCLGLYAQTPRFEKARETGIEVTDVQGSSIRQNDPRGILRDGTTEGYAQVIFEGIDGLKYRSCWSVRRARNKIEGTLQPDSMELVNLETGIPFPGRKTETLKEIERLAGLNFEQFTRSVLLAQGDFTAFLKATKDEKASLLEKLTGTHIYSQISKLVFQRYRDAEKAVQDLNLQKDTISLLDTGLIQHLEKEHSHLSSAFANGEKELQKLSAELQWHRQLKEISNGINIAVANLQTAEQTYEEASGRFEKAALIEKVQGAAILVNALQSAQKRIHEKQQIFDRNGLRLHELRQRKNSITIRKMQADEDLETAKAAILKARPLLQAAAALEVVIKEKSEQLAEAQKYWELASEEVEKFTKLFEAEQQRERNLEKTLRALEAWQERNRDRKAIAENRDKIITRLKEAGNTLKDIREYEAEAEQGKKESAILLKQKNDLQKEIQEKERILQQIKDSTALKQKEIEGVDPEELRQKIEGQQTDLHDLLMAQAHWENQCKEETLLAGLELEVGETRESLARGGTKLMEREQKLSEAKLIKDTHGKLLEKARLEQSANVEKLRQTLIADEPCAVCGSRHHPYAGGHVENATLLTIENAFRQAESKHEEILKSFTSLKGDHERLQSSEPKLTKELESQRTLIRTLREKWKSFSIFGEASAHKKENVALFLKSREEEISGSLASLKKKLEHIGKVAKETEELKARAERVSQVLLEEQNRWKDAERMILSNTERLERLEILMAKENAEVAKAQDELNFFFSNAGWFENWKKKPEEFAENILSFSQKWEDNERQYTKSLNEKEVVIARLSELNNQLKRCNEEADKRKNVFAKLNKEHEEKTTEREKIFQGRAGEEVEKELSDKLEAAEKVKEQRYQEAEELQNTLTGVETQQHATERDIEESKELFRDKKVAIEQWIAMHASEIQFNELLAFLQYSPEWRQKEKAELQRIEEARKHAVTVLNERKEALISHQAKRKTKTEESELERSLQEVSERVKKASVRMNEITFILKRNQQDFEKVEKLLKKIEEKQEVFENWGRLNEIIGSSDGKKFRQIAQEYTLDILLEFANIELEVLAKRYSLERIPGTLALQVADHDLGGEKRTVYSLSGGESFLVSLALALGLSSLSSARMKVESLFIDEGFGALDSQTLNIAMDALERLHNQGRKVGIISHVQELTERIPVQIKVEKVSAGKSRVEILGAF